jgi:hypothetical protein
MKGKEFCSGKGARPTRVNNLYFRRQVSQPCEFKFFKDHCLKKVI